jgi:hypothetical protein
MQHTENTQFVLGRDIKDPRKNIVILQVNPNRFLGQQVYIQQSERESLDSLPSRWT